MGSNDSAEGVIPYKAATLSGLTALLSSVPAEDSFTQHQRFIYDIVSPRLFSYILEAQNNTGKGIPPLLVARALECFASAMYDGIGTDATAVYNDALRLLNFFTVSTGAKQPA